MTTASKIAEEVINKAKQMRVEDGWVPMGVVPFDIHIKDGVATLTVISDSEEDARNQASVYMESDDFYD
jgi:hypothetical protein